LADRLSALLISAPLFREKARFGLQGRLQNAEIVNRTASRWNLRKFIVIAVLATVIAIAAIISAAVLFKSATPISARELLVLGEKHLLEFDYTGVAFTKLIKSISIKSNLAREKVCECFNVDFFQAMRLIYGYALS
jgi:hypothetical protein